MTPLKTIGQTLAQRMSGRKPSRTRSSVTAAAAGGFVAVQVYRGLRG